MLPAVFTVLFGIIHVLRKLKLFKVLKTLFMQWETVQAAWIRVFLICFMPISLIALQMIVPSEKYPDYPRVLYSEETELSGDLCSEIFKYYCLLVGGVFFFSLVVFVAFKNFSYARVYTLSRLSTYASELIFAYKATKQDILK